MINLDIRPSDSVSRPLLQVEGVEFVCLRGGSGHQSVENRRIVFYPGTVHTKNIKGGALFAHAVHKCIATGKIHVVHESKSKMTNVVTRKKNRHGFYKNCQPHANRKSNVSLKKCPRSCRCTCSFEHEDVMWSR